MKPKNKLNDLEKNEKIELRNSIKIDFQEITPVFLQKYEDWMVQDGGSITTVGIYLRTLRTIFNTAIRNKSISEDLYPFGKRKYEIPSAQNTKKAITLDEVRAIFKYETVEGSSEHRAKDFWLLSYLCNGINIKDISLLKLKDIKGDHIEFVRAKTRRKTKSNQKTIRIFITPQVRAIIDRWSLNKENPDDFLFPIINSEMSPEKQHSTIKEFTKSINKYIKRIAGDLGIEKHITTYTRIIKLSKTWFEICTKKITKRESRSRSGFCVVTLWHFRTIIRYNHTTPSFLINLIFISCIRSLVLLSVWLRQKGSPESKPVDVPHNKTGK